MSHRRSVKRVLRATKPIVQYYMQAQLHQLKFKEFPREMRNELIMRWGQETLKELAVAHELIGHAPMETPGLFLGNHLSYLDVPVLCAHVPVVFVAKAELSYWPLIGPATRIVGTIFVKRSSSFSRQASARAITKKIVEEEERVAIFPSGTTSLDENLTWKRGAFWIAKQHQIPVQAFRLSYSPKRLAAYIDDDTLIPHLLRLTREVEVLAKIEFAPPRFITDIDQDMREIKHWCSQPTVSKE